MIADFVPSCNLRDLRVNVFLIGNRQSTIGNGLFTALPATPYGLFTHWSTHAFTVLYQSCEFCGFNTQCPSSGK